jgi:TP901 family phage tail tape measure protein
MGRYSIETVFKLIDQISAPLDKVAGKGNKVGKALKRDFLAAQDSLDKFGNKLKTIGSYAIGASFAAIGAGLAISTKQFIEFDSAATAATEKFKDLDVTSETYAESVKKVGQTARDVAAITEYNAVDTAGALDKMAMAGLTSEQSMKLLMGTTNLATAAGMDLTTAVDIATDSLGAFGLMSSDASQLQVNLDRVSDVMAKTTNMFNTDMPGMFEAIKKGGPAFTSAGQSVESFSALIGVMASSGVKGSEAGTQLRNMMLSLANPSDKADSALKRLGITVKDQSGNYLDVIDIIGQFESATKDMGSAEKAAALATIFGTRTVTGMNILLQEGSEKLRTYRGDLENAGGAAANIAEAMRGSIKNKIEVLKSALTELGFKFVESFQEKGVGLIEKLTEAVSQFDPQPIISAMITAAQVIGSVIGFIWNMREIIMGVVIAWSIYKGAMLAAAAVAPLLTLIKVIKMLASGEKLATVAQWAFNAAANANPIGIIITAIGILIGLIILVVTHWDSFTAGLAYAWEWIKYVALVIWDGLCAGFQALTGFISENSEKVLGLIAIFTGPFGFIISMVNELRENWGMVVDTFKSDGIIAGLKRLGGVLLSGILAPIQGLLEMLSKIPIIGDKIAPAAGAIENFRNQLKGIDAETAAAEKAVPQEQAPSPRRERPESFSAFRSRRNPAPAEEPADAGSLPDGLTIPSSFSPPVFGPSGAIPQDFGVSPAAAAPSTAAGAAPRSMSQPALLNLRSPMASQIPQDMSQAAPAASSWSIPDDYRIDDYRGGIGAVEAPGAVPPAITQAASISPAVRVPVQWDFPAMEVPPDLIHPVIVRVQWAFDPPMPSISQTTTAGAVLPGLNRIAPREAVNTDPARAGRIVPPAAAAPVSRSVGSSLVMPDAPMTRAEQTAAEQIMYSRTENNERITLHVALDDGLKAKQVNPPKSPNIELEVSGVN